MRFASHLPVSAFHAQTLVTAAFEAEDSFPAQRSKLPMKNPTRMMALPRGRSSMNPNWVSRAAQGSRLSSPHKHGERVVALAAVGGLRESRKDGPTVPVIAFHGTSDPINPWDGGGATYWEYGIEWAMKSRLERDHCSSCASEVLTPDVVRQSRPTSDEPTVKLYPFAGGHVSRGSRFSFPEERFGAMPRDLDATRLIVEFFEHQGLGFGESKAAEVHEVTPRTSTSLR